MDVDKERLEEDKKDRTLYREEKKRRLALAEQTAKAEKEERERQHELQKQKMELKQKQLLINRSHVLKFVVNNAPTEDALRRHRFKRFYRREGRERTWSMFLERSHHKHN